MINFSSNVNRAIAQAAQKYGLPENFLKRVAMIESHGNPNAKSKKSSAGGLYQFLDSTAKQYQLNNKFDPFQATDAMGRLTKDNVRYLQTALGREPSEAELYLAHQQGPAGAVKLIKNPNMLASQLLGRQEVTLNGGWSEATARDFMNHIYKFYNQTAGASNKMPQLQQNNWPTANDERVSLPDNVLLHEQSLHGIEWLQKAMQGDKLIAENTQQSPEMMSPNLKKGFSGLLHLMKQNADAQNHQVQMAQQQMMQEPIMAGFSSSSTRSTDLTSLIDPSRKKSVSSYGRQKEEQLREKLLRRTGVYNV
ncbi:transglycosylase SLT domain-containing protein [Bartonella sp. B12(2025)]